MSLQSGIINSTPLKNIELIEILKKMFFNSAALLATETTGWQLHSSKLRPQMALQYLHLYGRVIDMETLWFAAPYKKNSLRPGTTLYYGTTVRRTRTYIYCTVSTVNCNPNCLLNCVALIYIQKKFSTITYFKWEYYKFVQMVLQASSCKKLYLRRAGRIFFFTKIQYSGVKKEEENPLCWIQIFLQYVRVLY